MSKEVFYAVIAGIVLLCLPGLLPSRMFKSDNKTFLISVGAFSGITFICLVVLIVFVYKFR